MLPLDETMTPAQKEEAIKFINLLCIGRHELYVSDWVNSGRTITYDQIMVLKRCHNGYMLQELLKGFASGATVVYSNIHVK